MTIRLRVALLFAGLAVGCTALVLGASFWLLGGHFDRTLPAVYADALRSQLAGQYLLALGGVALIASGLGWLIAARALAPVARMASVAGRVTRESLGERIALDGPRDELRDLADGLDGMLDRLQEVLEAQGRFVANASHELRTPLTVIRTEAEVTLADPDATVEDLREMGRIVVRTAERTGEMLDGLLVLAVAAQGDLRQEPADLAALGRRVASSSAREAHAAGVDLAADSGNRTPVHGDPALLERMIANLVENAIRHNRPGGTARLVVDHDELRDVARVRVTNDGEPVPADAVERLTAPFQRMRRTYEHGSAGLGLSIVRAVAEAHGGALTLEPRPAGGLEATVSLPVAASSLTSV